MTTCACLVDQEDEKLEGLALQLEPAALAAELKSAAKAEFAERIDGEGHRLPTESG